MNDKPTILYVDDEIINLQLFIINLKKKFHILTAESGYDGLRMLNTHPNISVVISDMRMPGMSGLEFIKLAKKEFQNVAYFILTGYDITDEIAQALNEKLIYEYFRKPFNIKDIEDAIVKALKEKPSGL